MKTIQRIKDGRMSHPLYWLHKAMIKRCNNPNRPEYKYYGGRGITVCDRWQGVTGFDNFLEDMGVRPKGYTLDRINNDGNYEPSNCRWASRAEQQHNKRTREYNGVSIDKYGVKWRARIKVNNKEISLGVYESKDDALAARKLAENKYWGYAYVA